MPPAEEHFERYYQWVKKFVPKLKFTRTGINDFRLVRRIEALSNEQLFKAIESAIPGFTAERFVPNLGFQFHYAIGLMHGECIRRGISNPWQSRIAATTESGRGANRPST